MNNTIWTAEMQGAAAAITTAADRIAASGQKQSALTEGLREVGRSAGAFFTLVGCGGGVGMGLDLMGHTTGAVDYGLGAGMFVGGLTVGARVVLDQLLGELIEFVQRERGLKVEVEPPVPTPARPARKKGLEIDLPNGYQILLENVRAGIVLAMVKATAQEYFRFGGRDKNFSQNQLGRPWGEHLSAAKNQLGGIGFLEDAPNNTMKFTKSGAEWLEQYFQGAQ